MKPIIGTATADLPPLPRGPFAAESNRGGIFFSDSGGEEASLPGSNISIWTPTAVEPSKKGNLGFLVFQYITELYPQITGLDRFPLG